MALPTLVTLLEPKDAGIGAVILLPAVIVAVSTARVARVRLLMRAAEQKGTEYLSMRHSGRSGWATSH